MTAQMLELQALPAALPTFFNAARTARRSPAAKIELPSLQVHVAALKVDPARLRAYNKLLGFSDGATLPLTYPHVLGSSLHMHLMAQPQFPLPMLGLVHLRNEIEQTQPLGIDDRLDLQVALTGSREVAQGLEFDFVTEFAVGDSGTLWRGISTYLYRIKGKKPARSRTPMAEIPLSKYLALNAPADIGRRYAKVSRDYNPIHLYSLTARLFGFKRAIATGMWTAARTLALLECELQSAPQHYAFQFKQPFLLPGRAALRYETHGDKVEFTLVGADAGKVHLAGTLR
ncbi:MAG: acyl dehydratase [Nevskia sp.]|nr:acyl dehydratase [Nevskia sp.]